MRCPRNSTSDPPEWKRFHQFAKIDKLQAVPVATVQLRYNGWVTELNNDCARKNLEQPAGLDNLLYTADADFSCFADLALTSPVDYRKEGLGKMALIADLNPFYRILAPVRTALIDGDVYVRAELIALVANALLIWIVCHWLKRVRYSMPFWV